jgi:hypothetical protein
MKIAPSLPPGQLTCVMLSSVTTGPGPAEDEGSASGLAPKTTLLSARGASARMARRSDCARQARVVRERATSWEAGKMADIGSVSRVVSPGGESRGGGKRGDTSD